MENWNFGSMKPSLMTINCSVNPIILFVSVWPDEVIDNLINTPLLAVAEAKKQDFEKGWGQCLAEMIACQKINHSDKLMIYGIVSTGTFWEFGQLSENRFTQHSISYSVATEPQKVFGILDYIFAQCEKQADSITTKEKLYAYIEN